jgi:hypothetical protein
MTGGKGLFNFLSPAGSAFNSVINKGINTGLNTQRQLLAVGSGLLSNLNSEQFKSVEMIEGTPDNTLDGAH